MNSSFQLCAILRTACLGLLLFLGLLSLPAQAVSPGEIPAVSLRFYRDTTQKIQIRQLTQLPETAWAQLPRHQNFGLLSDPIWLRIPLTQAQPPSPWLWVERGNLDEVCLYTQLRRHWTRNCAGSRIALSESEVRTSSLAFPAYSDAEYAYLRVQTVNLLIAPLRLLSRPALMEALTTRQSLDMLALGALGATLCYNLFVFLRLRDPAYLNYVIFGGLSAVYWFGFLFGYNRLLPQAWHDVIYAVAYHILALSMWFALEAYQRFLKMNSGEPIYRITRSLQILTLLNCIVPLLGWRPLAVVLSQLLAVSLVVILTGMLIWSLVRGNRSVALYLGGWSLMHIGVFILTLMFQGILPFDPDAMRLVSWGYVVSVMVMSMALAEQVGQLSNERNQLLDRQLHMIEQHNRDLETRVEARTQELQSALKELERSHESKDRVFSILAHDLRSPFASLNTMITLLERGRLKDTLEEMLPRMRKQVEGMYHSLENMLEWARTEMKGSRFQPASLPLKPLIDEVGEMYAGTAEHKAITLEVAGPESLQVLADRDQLRLILRNLVDNALKFTPPGGRVEIDWQQMGREARICIQDDGIGVSTEQQAQLFQANPSLLQTGTQGERGIGLGLQLCQTYAQRNGGRLTLESSPGQGCQFCLYLPTG